MKKSTIFTLLTVFVLIPLTLWAGLRLPGRWFYLTSTLIVIYTIVPFFLAFESRRPQARELVVIAVLCALAVASRAAFIMVPHFKPMTAIIMISAIAFGPQTGFLVGAVSAFASNFIFGQGPWTPWQMMAYGMGGLLAGVVYRKGWLPRKPLWLAFFGLFAVALVVGPLLDCCTVFTSLTSFTWASVLFVFGQGVPVNLVHGACTFLTLLLFSKPLLEKLERIQVKYGMMVDDHGL